MDKKEPEIFTSLKKFVDESQFKKAYIFHMKDIENSNNKEIAAEITNRRKIGIFGGS